MNNPSLSQHIQSIAPFLKIAHHIPGRVRLKIDAAILKNPTVKDLDSEAILQQLGQIRGIHRIQINKLARSCTIEYDKNILPQAAWADLLEAKATEAAQILFNIIEEKYSEYSQ